MAGPRRPELRSAALPRRDELRFHVRLSSFDRAMPSLSIAVLWVVLMGYLCLADHPAQPWISEKSVGLLVARFCGSASSVTSGATLTHSGTFSG